MSRIADRNNGQQQPGTDIEAVAPALTVFDQIQQQLETRKNFISGALSKRIDLDTFMARIMNEVRKNPQLSQCTFPSLMGAVVTSAQLGLEVGPLGHFYLTPRRNKGRWEVVPVIGYRGYIVLGRRAGGMSIDADDRREEDKWIFRRGTDPYLETSPPDRGGRGDVLGYWAAAKFDGGSAAHYMSIDDLEDHMRRYASDSGGNPQGFAKMNWDGWCRKTVIRQMAWKLPQSTEMARALEADEAGSYWSDAGSVVTITRDGRADEVEVQEGTPASGIPVVEQQGDGGPQDRGEPDPTSDPAFGTEQFRG